MYNSGTKAKAQTSVHGTAALSCSTETQIMYTGEKKAFSTNGAGETGCPLAKE